MLGYFVGGAADRRVLSVGRNSWTWKIAVPKPLTAFPAVVPPENQGVEVQTYYRHTLMTGGQAWAVYGLSPHAADVFTVLVENYFSQEPRT